MCRSNILISGDFNFHLDDPSDNDAKTFTDLLETFGIPTWLLKLCARELTPVIIKMINLPLSEGHVPDSWKVAILTPILKKYGFDLVFENVRPVSNLSFDAKATEKAVVNQLFEHCGDNAPLPTNYGSTGSNSFGPF